MKQNTKITLSAMMAALSTAFMLLSYFPYLTYAVPAVAGLFIMVLVIEINYKWALGGFITSAILVALMAEPESKLMYICLFGYYPIAKALIERLKKPALEWFLKLILYLIAIFVAYFVFSRLFGIDLSDFDTIGKFGIPLLVTFGGGVFVLYDIAVSRMAMMYLRVLSGKVKRIFKA